MLNFRVQRGVTLIEILIGLAVLGLLMSLGIPAFNQMIENMQVRTHAESIKNGLLLARAEALKRNQEVRFTLVNNLGGACAPSNTGEFWIVSQGNGAVDGRCDESPDPDPTANAFLLHKSDEGTRAASAVVATSNQYRFNGLGQMTAPAAATLININGPAGSTCGTADDKVRCLAIRIRPGGEIRMCDPAINSEDDARTC